MPYTPRITKCRLRTGGKSIDDLRERYRGHGLTYRDLESVKRALDLFDGITLYLSQWDYDGGVDYHVHGWDDDADEKMMLATYEAEQTHPAPQYKDQREAFVADWKAGHYDPGASFVFCPADVEELKLVQEEVKGDSGRDGKAEEKAPHRRKKKKARRRKR